jgi:ceramide glucosyltransferase
MAWVTLLGFGFAALAVIAIGYQLVALLALRRFFVAAAPRAPGAAPVSLLKPLHGAEPRLAENLASFLATDHAGPVQMVCGVGQPGDPAVGAVEALRRLHPGADIVLTTGPRAPGANAKMGNLAAMLPAARHDVLVLSDSDMAVDPDYLPVLLAALDRPGVGAVTCLYAGRGDAGLWSQVSAGAISWTGLPNMVMAVTTAIAQPCLGSTIAIRRETLERIGGFARFADELADDYALGEAVAALGLKVAVPPLLLTHACAQRTAREAWGQHLRWSKTIRGVAPKRHAGSGITHALAFALLTVPFAPAAGAALTAAALAVRIALAASVNRIAGRKVAPLWLLPLADFLEFAAFCASFATRRIDWRGHRLTMADRRRIAPSPSRATESR